jgi:stage V sporulation protein AE
MIYVNAFIFCGLVCMLGQLILDNTNLTPGHITTIFVIVGAFLDIFSIYDLFVNTFGGGALVCITSFGHLLVHGALLGAKSNGILGLMTNIYSLVQPGISSCIIFSFLFTLLFKPKN